MRNFVKIMVWFLFFFGLTHQAHGKFFEVQKVGKARVIVLLQGEKASVGENFLNPRRIQPIQRSC